MLVISVAALVVAVALARRLRARFGAWNATLIDRDDDEEWRSAPSCTSIRFG